MASDNDEMEINKNEEEEEEDDDDDDMESDDDDDSSEDDVDDSKQETELVTLRQSIQSDPYNYQSYINYITLSQQYGNFEHLRFARQAMSEVFPLTPQLWLEWIRDEIKFVTSTTEENKDIIQLFERALNDYLSVSIWLEYIQYRIPFCSSENSIDELRNLFERALSSCGVHLTDGSRLWTPFIEAENAILDGIISMYNENNTNEQLKDKILERVDFILQLYRRELSVPLRNMERIYSGEYQDFCLSYKEYLPSGYHEKYDLILKKDFEQACEHLQKCEQFEQELIQTHSSLATYQKYIQFETKPARIQCLYERAILDHCLEGELWLAYIDFIEEYLPTNRILQTALERSLRNSPWIADLWIRFAQHMESNQLADHSELKQIYNRGLNSDPTNLVSFVQLQLAYFQYRRRHFQQETLAQSSSAEQLNVLKDEIRHLCEYACDQYQELFASSTNANLFLKYNGQLELFWIYLENQLFHSIENARQIWNGRTLMSKAHNQLNANLWKNFYYMEIQYGDEKHARRVLYRALNYVDKMDFPLSICEILLEHENKYGNIQQLKEAKEKIRQAKRKFQIEEKPKRQKTNNKPKEIKGKPKGKTEKTGEILFVSVGFLIEKNMFSLASTSNPVQTNGKTTDQQSSSPRKRKLSPQESENAKKKPSTATVDSEGFKIPPPPPALSVPTTTTTNAASSSSIPPNIKNIDHLNTVFIANLAYDVTEDQLQKALAPAGEIKEIRIVKHEWSGKSKGFCYVDFLTTEGYRQALKLDHAPINGRPMYISPYDPNRSTSNDLTKKFKYSTTLEQNKLFLSNLPFSTTNEQLQSLFADKGFKTKDIRIVTHKSGKSKGLAYVEFENAQEASQAVVKADGTVIDGHTIKVAISNPPTKKDPLKVTPGDKPIVNRATSLGEAPKATGPRGKGRSQIALVPRKLTLATSTTKK
mgnify:FL=1